MVHSPAFFKRVVTWPIVQNGHKKKIVAIQMNTVLFDSILMLHITGFYDLSKMSQVFCVTWQEVSDPPIMDVRFNHNKAELVTSRR
jgi:hypothetical protein